MTTSELLEHINAEPFQPFMLYITDGRWLRIDHPDQILLTLSSAFVGVGRIGRHYSQVAERISLVHITGLREIDPAQFKPPGTGNTIPEK